MWNIYKIQLLQHGQNTSVRHNSESNKRIMVTLLKSQIQNTKAILLHVQLCKSALLLPAVKERKFSQSVAMCACLHPVFWIGYIGRIIRSKDVSKMLMGYFIGGTSHVILVDNTLQLSNCETNLVKKIKHTTRKPWYIQTMQSPYIKHYSVDATLVRRFSRVHHLITVELAFER